MARNAGDVLVKRNSKLESFLQKNLHEDTFQRIRCHEACIVVSDTEDKAYKFVVLTDDWLYLTENPPKRVHPVVHLGDVLSVELVNEFPDFLDGEERDCCQHVVISYLTLPPKSKKKGEKGGGTGPGSVTGGDTSARPGTPGSARPLGTARPGTPAGSDAATLTARSTPRSGGIMSARNAKHAREARRVHEENGFEQSSGSVTFDRLVLDDELLEDSLDFSSSPSSRQEKKRKSRDAGGSGNQSATGNLARTLRNRYSSSEYERVRTRNRPLPNPADEWDENGRPTDTRRKEPLKLMYAESGELHLSLDQLEDGEDDVTEDAAKRKGNQTSRREHARSASRSGGRAVNGTTPQESKPDEKKSGGKGGLFSIFRRGTKKEEPKKEEVQETETDGDAAVAKEEEPALRRTALHLYILNYSSPVLMLTRAAWNNYLIRGTLLLDESYERKTTSLFTPRTASEKLGILYTQLTAELLGAERSMEDTFRLLHELKVATERNHALKHFFWKKPEVFLLLIHQLQLYLPSPRQPLSVEYDAAKAARADQLELVNMALETLALMLRETEVLPTRLNCLKQPDNGVKEDNNNSVRSKSSSRKSATWSLADLDRVMPGVSLSQLRQLCEEFTAQASRVLYELILIAHQANWGDSDGSFLNICWLIKLLDQLNTTEEFVRGLVNATLHQMLPTLRREELSPDDAVLLFMQLSVIQTLLEYSPTCSDFIRNNFYEEFKYYIQAPVILQKLPPFYPISPHAVRLIEEVMAVILNKHVTLDLEEHYQQLF